MAGRRATQIMRINFKSAGHDRPTILSVNLKPDRAVRGLRIVSRPTQAAVVLALAIVLIFSACSAPGEVVPAGGVVNDGQRAATETASVSELLETIGPGVAALRGLPTWDVPADLMTREMLESELEKAFAEDYPAEISELDQLELELLGILSPGQDVSDIQKALLSEQIVGFYDSESEAMFAIGDDSTPVPLLIWTLAHEYVHALQDRKFDLDAIEESIGENHDAILAFRALVEGDASLAGTQYALASLTSEDIDVLVRDGDSGGDAFSSTPRVIREILLFPYEAGSSYVSSLLSGGWSAVNDAYDRLPDSTEQIMHQSKYRADEKPLEVDLPGVEHVLPPGWQEVRRNVTGEFYLGVILEQAIDRRAARQAAEGWGGDAYALYRSERGKGLMAMKFRWDTRLDLDEFWTALVGFLAGGGLGPGTSETGETTALWSGSERSARAQRLADSVLLVIGHDPAAVRLAASSLSRR